MTAQDPSPVFAPLDLPCGVTLKNRIVKAAMSDSLGDGAGNPTRGQMRLYERWAMGGCAAAIIGEVQHDPRQAEKPGNLVLNAKGDADAFAALARRGSVQGCQLWLQLGHAGAMAHPPISSPKGPSALDLPGLTCAALTPTDIAALPAAFAATAARAQALGFAGVQIHAAHGFLLSQFLSPLFNRRSDAYGGDITNRMRLLLEVIDAVRGAVGPRFPVVVKLNCTDQLQGGLQEEDALRVVAALDATSVDLIEFSGGTYFPGAKSASDSAGSGPYFVAFSQRARLKTTKPLMVTGGFKTRTQVIDAIASGATDLVGLARALVLEPDLPNTWRTTDRPVSFPRFADPPAGGVTAWYTMRLTALAEDRGTDTPADLHLALRQYTDRDTRRVALWNARFGPPCS